jgi:hypothetical protein
MAYRQREGQQTPPERPKALPPALEKVKGKWLPYRGSNDHGVKIPDNQDPEAYYENSEAEHETGDGVYVPEHVEHDPVPVRIVQGTSAKEQLNWRAVRVPVTDVGSRILGRHDKRRNVTITNQKTGGTYPYGNAVYVGPDSGISPYTGYQLLGGDSITLRTTEDIWAICDSGNTAELSIAFEYGVEIDVESKKAKR